MLTYSIGPVSLLSNRSNQPEVGISTAVFDGKVVVLCVNGGPESVQVVPSVYVSRVWGG